MADVIISPNMGLPVPVVGEDLGPDWANNINASLSAIDSHNHSAGQGVAITTDGLNINADLPLNNNNLITARTLRFTPQVTAPVDAADLGCLAEIGVDLYYIDGAGNQIRITQSGSLAGAAGTITGLPSGTASASFAAGTFSFQSSTNTPAALSVGPVTIGQAVSSGFGVTVSAAGSQSANYGLSLPVALPASTKILSVDSSGNIGASYGIDTSTMQISANDIGVKPAGINTTQLADLSVTNAKLADCNFIRSLNTGPFSTSSTSYFTLASVDLTGTGRPVIISVQPANGAGLISDIHVVNGFAQIAFETQGADVAVFNLRTDTPASLQTLIQPTAGLHTYIFKMKCSSATAVTGDNLVLCVREV